MKKLFVAVLSAVLCLTAPPMFGQGRISGKVTDANGEAVPGVAVFVRGTSVATTTGADGSYSISAKESDNLLFSCIGYEDAVIKVGKGNVVNVTLSEDIETLEGIVVTGYQTLSKERATGSFDVLDKAQLEKPTTNIASRLIGAAPGLAYSQDIYGNPTFSIRGTSSFKGDVKPLIVVDGFPIEGDIDSINPNDVENVTVLKDAAAASIWGAKSANGVIVITTKNASATSSDKPVVNVEYTGFYKVSPKLDLDYTLSQASTDDVIDYELTNFDKDWAHGNWPTPSTTTMYEQSRVTDLLIQAYNGEITRDEALSQANTYRKYNNYDQIRKYLLQNASTHHDNININIATKRSQTAISLLYQNDHKIYKGDASNKYQFSVRNKTSIFNWLDLNINGNYSYTKSSNNGYGLPGLSPYEMLVDSKGEFIRYPGMVNPLYMKYNVPIENFPYQDWSWNPIEEQNNRNRNTMTSLARLQAGLTFKIIKGLTIDAKAQYEMVNSRTHNYYNDTTFEVRDLVNSSCTWDRMTDMVTPNIPAGGVLDQSSTQRDILTLRAQANFNRTFADKHNVAAVAGIETINNIYQRFGYPRTYGYDDNLLTVGSLPHGFGGIDELNLEDWQGGQLVIPYLNTFEYTTDRYFSAFANASYTYNGKYTVSGSVRTDASNLITDDPAYRYAPFWSVGASWQMAKEDFMKSIDWIDMLNIRATFGHNGNVDKSTTFKPLLNPSPSPSVITHEQTIGVYPDSNPGGVASYGNPTLRWERTKTFDIGIDFDMFGGKLNGKFDVYNKHSFDLIADVTRPNVQGTSSITLNNGEISNKGFEFEIGSTIPITKDIAWTGTLSFSYNNNVIKHLEKKPSQAYHLVYSSASTPSSGWYEGYDMNTLWAYKYGGIKDMGTAASPDLQPTIMGKDGNQQTLSQWPSGDAMNISYNMGTRIAPVNAALSTSFKIYDFDLSFIFTGKFGHKFFRECFNYPTFEYGRVIPNAKYAEIKNCDPNQMVPLPLNPQEGAFDFWDRFYPYMSYLVADASFIRCQEINLTYNLPKVCCDWLKAKSFKVFFQANNPFNIYFNKWQEDPEFKRGTVRLQSSYMFGVKCNF